MPRAAALARSRATAAAGITASPSASKSFFPAASRMAREGFDMTRQADASSARLRRSKSSLAFLAAKRLLSLRRWVLRTANTWRRVAALVRACLVRSAVAFVYVCEGGREGGRSEGRTEGRKITMKAVGLLVMLARHVCANRYRARKQVLLFVPGKKEDGRENVPGFSLALGCSLLVGAINRGGAGREGRGSFQVIKQTDVALRKQHHELNTMSAKEYPQPPPLFSLVDHALHTITRAKAHNVPCTNTHVK